MSIESIQSTVMEKNNNESLNDLLGIQQLNICIDNQELCESIYKSYKGQYEPRIHIEQINSLFCFIEGGKKKYLKNFKLKLKNMYIKEIKMNDKDIITDSELEITEEEYLKKYFYENKLTFDGFGHYIQGLSYGNYLKFEKDKFRITDWYNKIMFALMKSSENAMMI